MEAVSIVPKDRLSYGIQLPIQAQSTVFVEDWQLEATPADLAAVARAADESGFFYVAVCDHVAVPRDRAEAMSTTWYDTMTTLGWLAGQTTRVRLLSHVFVPAYRHPLVTSKALSTLDHLSGGRAVLGVGAGHVEGEFEALGVPFGERGAILDESIDLVRAALLDEFPSHAGPRFPVSDLGQRPRPAQDPRPPVWVGGSSPAAIRRAARRGDGWLPQGNPPKRYPEMLATLRAERERTIGDQPIDVGALVENVHVGPVPDGLDVGRWALTGSPAEIASGLRRWRERGADHVQFRLPSRSVEELTDQITAFGAEVGPSLVD